MPQPSDTVSKPRSLEDTPTFRTLLVEDNQDLAEATADFLSGEGLVVRTALSGRDALEMAPSFAPQLVLCDLNLPDMSGLEVVRQLRSSPATEHSYMVILTAMAGTTVNRAGADQAGVDAFLSKPITIEAIRTLREALAPSRRRRDVSAR